VEAETFAVGRRFVDGDITIHSLSIQHDAPQVALVFEIKVGTFPKGSGPSSVNARRSY
jgi:hypothetical protein